jgi:hypothetical protein
MRTSDIRSTFDPSLTHCDCQSRFGIRFLSLVWTLEGAVEAGHGAATSLAVVEPTIAP